MTPKNFQILKPKKIKLQFFSSRELGVGYQ